MEWGYLRRGIKNNGTKRALKTKLCEAKETQWGCELQYWLYAPKLCGAWGVGVGADGPCSPGEKSRVAQETGFIHMKKTQTVDCEIWCTRRHELSLNIWVGSVDEMWFYNPGFKSSRELCDVSVELILSLHYTWCNLWASLPGFRNRNCPEWLKSRNSIN